MANRRKCLFYPYSDETYGLVKGLLLSSEAIDILAPIGTGIVGKDIAYVVNRNEIKQIVKSTKEIDYRNYDTLIISSHINYKLCKNEMLEIINQSKKENMEIIYLGEYEEINKSLESYNKYSLGDLEKIKEIETAVKRYDELNLPLYNSKTPIVYIGGILETIDSFDIGLQIKLGMEKLGYSVSLITKEMDGKILGAINYPKEFMKENEYIESQMVSINRWVQAIDYVEKPDVILMDIPKGMIQYSDSFYNTFGIYTYMISQTLPADYLILTVPPAFTIKEYIDDIDKYFKDTIGKEIDTCNVTNAIYDIGTEVTDILDKPLYISEIEINQLILNKNNIYDLNLINLNKRESVDIAINNIIERFS